VIAGYIGAIAGWVAGFIFAFLIVLTVEKDSPDIVRCSLCLSEFPAGAEMCRFCGSLLREANVRTLTVSCLRAGPYALSNPTSVYWVAVFCVMAYLLHAISGQLLREFPELLGQYETAILGLCGFVGLVVLAIWVRFFLLAIAGTLTEHDRAPNLLLHLKLRDVVAGLAGLMTVVFYVVPILTIPLLPLGLIWLCAPAKAEAFNLARAIRTAWRGAKNYANLWLMVLVWAAAMALSIVLTKMIFLVIAGAIRPVGGISGMILSYLGSAIEIGIYAAVIAIFGLAICRCIGLFGRQNAPLFRHRPRKPMRLVGGGN
jgi:hypothetical protein